MALKAWHIDKFASSKLQTFVPWKILLREWGKKATDSGKIFANHISYEALLFRIYKEFPKFIIRKQTVQLKVHKIMEQKLQQRRYTGGR